MLEPKIFILGPEPAVLGAEIYAILSGVQRYNVHFSPHVHPSGIAEDFKSDLIIPLLSAPAEKAIRLLSSLRSSNGNTPLLPVLSSEDLTRILDDDHPSWTDDFLITPIKPVEVLARVGRLLANKTSAEPRADLARAIGLTGLVGRNPAFVTLKRKLPLVAGQTAPVLITGETGTGKELFARALHYLSARVDHPFLPVNCGAIPTELFESELFGHRKGAFTGAWCDQSGLVEEAEGGTLFLDEIESLPLPAQVKLLRFIEDHTYHSVGSGKLRRADVWIVAATNLDLRAQIRQKTFREDLFYRLAVINLSLPPLRERREDIPLLVQHFLARHAVTRSRREQRLSQRAMEVLCGYSWPGNIRELQNVIQQIVVLNEAQMIEAEDLPIAMPTDGPSPDLCFRQAKAKAIAIFEKSYVEQLLQLNHGNLTRAAQVAQKDRRSFSRLVKKHLGKSRTAGAN
jgi:DNA-binding NtrC family response regulator